MSKKKKKSHSPTKDETKSIRASSAILFSLFCVALTLACTLPFCFKKTVNTLQSDEQKTLTHPTQKPLTLNTLLSLPNEEIEAVDIGHMSLLCGTFLPGCENYDVEKSLAVLERMSEVIQEETKFGLPTFYSSPEKYNKSEELFRMAVMASLLQQEWNITYTDKLNDLSKEINQPVGQETRPKLYQDGRNIFLQGCTTEYRSGTCVSLPVLYVTLGRKLGYPVSLAITKMHVYCRWDKKDGSHINFEVTSKGIAVKTDEEYKSWPTPLTQKDLDKGCYLRSLTNLETLGFLMHCRAGVLYSCRADKKVVFNTLVKAFNYFDKYPDTQIMMSWQNIAPHYLSKNINRNLEGELFDAKESLSFYKSNITRLREDIEAVKHGRTPIHGTMKKVVDPLFPANNKRQGLDAYNIHPHILETE